MSDATIKVDSNSAIPAYRQIVDQVRLHLNSGALQPGDRLLSIRSLAAQLGVHFNTIAEAYRELAQEGWIDLAHGRRALVLAHHAERSASATETDALRRRLRHLLAEMRLKGISATIIQHEIQAVLRG